MKAQRVVWDTLGSKPDAMIALEIGGLNGLQGMSGCLVPLCIDEGVPQPSYSALRQTQTCLLSMVTSWGARSRRCNRRRQ